VRGRLGVGLRVGLLTLRGLGLGVGLSVVALLGLLGGVGRGRGARAGLRRGLAGRSRRFVVAGRGELPAASDHQHCYDEQRQCDEQRLEPPLLVLFGRV